MKTSYRVTRLLLVLTAFLLPLSACATPSSPQPTSGPAPATVAPQPTSVPQPSATSSQPVTVRMWAFPFTSDDETNIWKPLVSKFESEHPGIKIEVELQSFADRRAAMLTAYAAGDNPDVSYLNTDMVPQFASKGVLEPLQDKVPQDVKADYPPGLIQAWTYGGNLVMLGILAAPWGSVYNKDVVAKVGWDPEKPPYTWDDMRKFCAQAKTKGIYCWGTSPNGLDIFTLTWQAGGHTLNADGTASAINSPEGLEAMNFILEANKNGWIPPGSGSFFDKNDPFSGPRDYFASGKQAIGFAQDMNAIKLWQDQVPGIKLGTQPAMMNKRQASYGGAGSYGIFSNSKVKDAALQWVLFLVDPENMLFFDNTAGFPPVRASALKNWATTQDKASADFAGLMAYGDGSRDGFLYFIEQYTIYKEEVQAAMVGQKTAAQALQSMEARVNQVIAQASATATPKP